MAFCFQNLQKGGTLWLKHKQVYEEHNIKKIVPVKGYTKSDGTRVGAHRRSTPR